MTPQAQRIAIAEACGWEWKPGHFTEWGATEPLNQWHDTNGKTGKTPPDYLNDLNAMREALNTLDNATGRELIENLCKIRGGWEHNTYFDLFVRSTASEWSGAFLRTIGKWRDE